MTTAEPASPGESAPAPAVFRVVEVASVDIELPDQFPVLRLEEAEPPSRELSFRIGVPEGVAIAHALRHLATPRPLTHELFTTLLKRLGVDIVAVRLTGREAGTYVAELDLMATRGREVLACRPTDGIALALRQVVPAPVLVDERLFTERGDVTPA
jgi:uncharacterized protein